VLARTAARLRGAHIRSGLELPDNVEEACLPSSRVSIVRRYALKVRGALVAQAFRLTESYWKGLGFTVAHVGTDLHVSQLGFNIGLDDRRPDAALFLGGSTPCV
jgi:hypothetical protein